MTVPDRCPHVSRTTHHESVIRHSKESVMETPRWPRVVLKLSGEAFAGGREFGFDAETVRYIAREVAGVHQAGAEIAVVVGGGNIMRGSVASEAGMDRVAADHIGMMATVQNALALQDALEKLGEQV